MESRKPTKKIRYSGDLELPLPFNLDSTLDRPSKDFSSTNADKWFTEVKRNLEKKGLSTIEDKEPTPPPRSITKAKRAARVQFNDDIKYASDNGTLSLKALNSTLDSAEDFFPSLATSRPFYQQPRYYLALFQLIPSIIVLAILLATNPAPDAKPLPEKNITTHRQFGLFTSAATFLVAILTLGWYMIKRPATLKFPYAITGFPYKPSKPYGFYIEQATMTILTLFWFSFVMGAKPECDPRRTGCVTRISTEGVSAAVACGFVGVGALVRVFEWWTSRPQGRVSGTADGTGGWKKWKIKIGAK
ncbi:uncharacterized protein SPPG_00283 [Spizellomyces punctatus DAOM BR117]|uniref:Uncharacterized protein n=1 Tax=Spizellomyces punctatus (strain DAOM BR117) TaxID=645134 RepID=A0A0L0HTB1_SPIPD|nr:uncharacterized protein SPPG_00283 [Spizellomyces punctatus DAOM BR117]KND04561.1 hypothetical protein SPPG_00283 [Spizellomyces punctatus DAOM BR117]|eukprot:XP_016612600.1 hypothetical protein SPPG_00283 [Spizellomyces punctatus DAOM BR117]